MNRAACAITRTMTRGAVPLVCGLLATLAIAGRNESASAAGGASGTRAGDRAVMIDPAVRPAGGAGCRECGPSGCRHCHRHHHGCRDGVCVPSCPVRPGTFGFYGTQWRRWPGEGVVPVSGTSAPMPVQPPKSAVPDADEESFTTKPDQLPEPEGPQADAGEQSPFAPEPAAEPTRPSPADGRAGGAESAAESRPLPNARPQQGADTPAAEPADEKPAAKPANDNLFDDSSARRVRRKIPVHAATVPKAPADAALGSRVVVTAHAEEAQPARASGSASVPRVAFDPRGIGSAAGTSRAGRDSAGTPRSKPQR